MKKLLIALLVSLLALFAFAGCGAGSGSEPDPAAEEETAGQEAVEEETEQQGSGFWEVDSESGAVKLPENVQGSLQEATELLTGNEFTPIAYFSRQIVSGNNYQVLCRSTLTTTDPEPSLQVVVVYQDLQGAAELLNIADFDIARYAGESSEETETGPVSGGWEIPEDYTTADLPEKVKAAYDAAAGQQEDITLTPMAYLGSQNDSGTNYAVLVHASGGQGDSIRVATIHEDPDGKSELKNMYTLDPSEYGEVEDGDEEY